MQLYNFTFSENSWAKIVTQILILTYILVYQDDSSDELSEVMDDLLLPASDTDDNWFQEDEEDEDENDSEGESENDLDENEENNDLDMEDNSSDNEAASLVNGKIKMNGDDNMDSD